VENPGADGRIIKMDFQEVGLGGGGEWTGLIWLKIGTGGGLL